MLRVPQVNGVGQLVEFVPHSTDEETVRYLTALFAGQPAVVQMGPWLGTGEILIDYQTYKIPNYGFVQTDLAIQLINIEFNAVTRLVELNKILRCMGGGLITVASALNRKPIFEMTATYMAHPIFGEKV